MKNLKRVSFFSTVVLLFLITSGAYADPYDYKDVTNVQMFLSIKNPQSNSAFSYWADVIGKPMFFDTFGADLSGNTFSIFTNWNPSSNEGLYKVNLNGGLRTADLFIDNNSNGTFDYAIRLDTEGKGTIFSNPDFETSQEWITNRVIDGFYYGGLYNQGLLSLAPPVWAKSAGPGSTASVNWTNGRVDVDLTGLNLGNDWSFFWGTATCSNDAITGDVKGVPEPGMLLLLGVGLVGLGGLRRKFKSNR